MIHVSALSQECNDTCECTIPGHVTPLTGTLTVQQILPKCYIVAHINKCTFILCLTHSHHLSDCVRSQIRKRGIKVFMGLCALYQKLDEDGTGRLNKVELDKSLLDFHIEVPQEVGIVDVSCQWKAMQMLWRE